MLFPPFIDINEMKNQEIDRHHDNHYQYRCKQFTRAYPKEEIQQTDLKQVINQMTKTKANRIMRGWLGTKGKESSQEVVADKSHSITSRKGDIGIRNQQDQAIYAVMNGRRYSADNSKTDKLPELIPANPGDSQVLALLILIIVQHFFHVIERTTFYLFINLANIQSDSSYG